MTEEEFAASLRALTEDELKARLIAVLAETGRRRREDSWQEWEGQNVRYALGRRSPAA